MSAGSLPSDPAARAIRVGQARRTTAIERAVRGLACVGVADGDDDVLRVPDHAEAIGVIEVKGKGPMRAWLLTRPSPVSSPRTAG